VATGLLLQRLDLGKGGISMTIYVIHAGPFTQAFADPEAAIHYLTRVIYLAKPVWLEIADITRFIRER